MKSLSFFKGLSWMILLNILVKPLWIFFIDRQVQNAVGNEAYGKYFAVLSLSYVLLFFADAGLTNMLNQKIANHQPVDVASVIRIKIFLLLLFSLICFFTAWISGFRQWDILIYVVLIQALTSFFVFLRGILTAHQFFTADAWFSVIDKILMILICGAIIYTNYFGHISLLFFLEVQGVCTGLAVILLFSFIAYRKLIRTDENKKIRNFISLVMPFSLILLLMGVHYRLDGFLLERLHPDGAHEAGIYAAAYRLLDACNMAGYMVATFLVPYIARHQNERMMVDEVVLNVRHGLIFFATGVVCFTILFAPWLQQLLYHSNEMYHARVMQFCIASLPGYYLVHIYGSVLTATARFKQFTVILIFTVLINLVLNLVLIPSYGALGSCIAALASQFFCGLACFIAATKNLSTALNLKSCLVYLANALFLTAFFYFSKMAISNVWIILATAACISVMLLTTQLSFFKKYFISFR